MKQSVLSDVETCGETMTKHLNAVSRTVVQQLMKFTVTQIDREEQKLLADQAENSKSKKKIRNLGEEQQMS